MNENRNSLTLEDAAAALNQMTPEDYVDLQRFISASEEQLPEAPSSVNFRVRTKRGLDVQFTLRDWDENRLLARLLPFAKLVDNALGIETSSSQAAEKAAPNPQEIRITSDVDPAIVDRPGVEMFTVSSLEYSFTRAKSPFLKVRGGRFTKWGYPAYNEVIPESVDYGKMEQGVEDTNIPSELMYAYVDMNAERKKIIAFGTTR